MACHAGFITDQRPTDVEDRIYAKHLRVRAAQIDRCTRCIDVGEHVARELIRRPVAEADAREASVRDVKALDPR